LSTFAIAEESLKVGSYLKVSDNENVALICIIESFSIDVKENQDGDSSRKYIIDAYPLGTLKNGEFHRGGDELAIPPKKVIPATKNEIESIYSHSINEDQKFCFSSLSKIKMLEFQ